MIGVIIIAYTRNGFELSKTELDYTAKEMFNYWENKNFNSVINGIEKGSMGAYGIPFKMSVAVLGSWIYKFINESAL